MNEPTSSTSESISLEQPHVDPKPIEKDDQKDSRPEDLRLEIRLEDPKGRLLNVLEAAEKGYIDLLRKFYRIDPNLINIQDSDGYTPLHRACYSNKINTVKWLIENGANVRARTEDGWEPIHSAAQWGHAPILRILLAYGADINSRTNGHNTPFHLAALRAQENARLIEYLLFGRSDVNLEAKNISKDTPYDICKRNSMLYKLWELL